MPLRQGILEGASQTLRARAGLDAVHLHRFLPMFSWGAWRGFCSFRWRRRWSLPCSLVCAFAHAGADHGDFLLREKVHHSASSQGFLSRFQRGFERQFERLRGGYHFMLESLCCIASCSFQVPVACLLAFILLPFLGQNFFPDTDSGSHPACRGDPACALRRWRSFATWSKPIFGGDSGVPGYNILDNIGLPYSTSNTQHLTNARSALRRRH